MAILVNDSSRIMIQGITGRTGRAYTARMLRWGTPLVAGVTPGKSGETVDGVPVFNTVGEAREATEADTSLVVVPPFRVKGAVVEAIEAGVRLLSIYTEHVPIHDAADIVARARAAGACLIGPNAAGVVSPGKANISDLNDAYLDAGRVGIVSKSGTLTYEVIDGLSARGLGVSSVVCLGGDPIIGTTYADVLSLFAQDPETDTVVLLGEIGGLAEIEAARVWSELKPRSRLVAYVAGQSAPEGKRMGHAGAIVASEDELATSKMKALRDAGAAVARSLDEIAGLVADGSPAPPQRRPPVAERKRRPS